jgi:hypothetical protein
MSRFKELNRIQAAIKNVDRPELDWALSFCRLRLNLASRKDHTKHWSKLERAVSDALESISDSN